MKKLILVITCLIAVMSLADNCKRCNNKGYFEDYFMCPLCRGYFFISPAWFDLSTGNTRWTETTYWTGLQTKSDVRKKMFSFKKCPGEVNMTKTVYICDCCGMEVDICHLHKCYKEIQDWTGYKNIVKTWELCENCIDRIEAAMEAEAAKLKGMCVPSQGAYSNGGGE